MDRELLLAVLSLCGTLLGSLAGILTSSKLLDYRIAQLEKKVARQLQRKASGAGGKAQGRKPPPERSGGGDRGMMNRVTALLSIKSLVTLALTAVFAVLALRADVSPQELMTVFTVIIGFYFGTQSERTGGKPA